MLLYTVTVAVGAGDTCDAVGATDDDVVADLLLSLLLLLLSLLLLSSES